MVRALHIPLVLLVLLIPVTPTRAEVFSDYKFTQGTSFPAPDSLTFDVTFRGAAPGADGTLRKGEATLTTKQVQGGEYDKLIFTYAGTEPGGQQLDWSATLESKTCKPWGYTRTWTDERGTERLDLTFADGQIQHLLTQVNGETINRTLTNIGDFSLQTLLFLGGRGLEFETGNVYQTSMLDPEQMRFTTPILTITGTELITVPAGIYECWKVEMKTAGQTEIGYYAVKNPRILAQFESGDRIWQLRRHNFISEDRPAGRTTRPATPKPPVVPNPSGPHTPLP